MHNSTGCANSDAVNNGDPGSQYRDAEDPASQAYQPTLAAPGQAAVIYDCDRVLAGGWVAR